MSRDVDPEGKLSDDDKRYLHERGRLELSEEDARKLYNSDEIEGRGTEVTAPSPLITETVEPHEPGPDAEQDEDYENWSHDRLQEEARNRKDAGAEIKVSGSKAELIERLREHDGDAG
jgi:hypothetical protein